MLLPETVAMVKASLLICVWERGQLRNLHIPTLKRFQMHHRSQNGGL